MSTGSAKATDRGQQSMKDSSTGSRSGHGQKGDHSHHGTGAGDKSSQGHKDHAGKK